MPLAVTPVKPDQAARWAYRERMTPASSMMYPASATMMLAVQGTPVTLALTFMEIRSSVPQAPKKEF